MTDPQEIPWKRLSLEATAIVVSILLAFSIDAWWNERQENVREKHQIQALITEFEGNRNHVESELEALQEHTSNLQRLRFYGQFSRQVAYERLWPISC
jgi:hypothetical protein